MGNVKRTKENYEGIKIINGAEWSTLSSSSYPMYSIHKNYNQSLKRKEIRHLISSIKEK